jgi:hypothetical protein
VAELVFNLAEVGISDWEDHKTKKTPSLRAMLDQTIHHGVSRNVKHISLIACLSGAGESLLHYVITSQNFPTVQEHLKTPGVRFGRDFASKFNQKPYINAGIFLASIRTILLPYIDIFRCRAVLAHEIAVLLMAHYSADVSDDVIHILTEARVCVITFAPHTTQIFQVLDLTLFGVLKRCPRYELPFDENNATAKVITNVYHKITQTMVRPNVWGTFRALALEFEFDTRREPYELLFDDVKLREGAGFHELCSVDFPLDQISGRRRTDRFDRINKPE